MNTQLHYEVIITRFEEKTSEFRKVYGENAKTIFPHKIYKEI